MSFGRISRGAGFVTDRRCDAVWPYCGTFPEGFLEVTPLFVAQNANQGRLRVVDWGVALWKGSLPARRDGASSASTPAFASFPLIATYTAGSRLSKFRQEGEGQAVQKREGAGLREGAKAQRHESAYRPQTVQYGKQAQLVG
jgi:hypothetical protein